MKSRNLQIENSVSAIYESAAPFEQTDGGRSLSSHPGEYNDCTVTSLAVATGTDYDLAHEFLSKNGRKPKEGFEYWNQFLDRQKEIFGMRIIKHSFPAIKNQPRMRAKKFALTYRRGNFILTFIDHVAPVTDGIIRDHDDTYLQRVVYTAYEFRK